MILDKIERRFKEQNPATSEDRAVGTAAVLMALVDYPDDPAVILTKRAEHLKAHPGQVSFPGGKYEQHDVDLLATALRETREEIGLHEGSVRILAELPPRRTRFEMRVVPYVGVVSPGHTYTIDPSELDHVFEVPVSYFLDHNNICYREFDMVGNKVEMPCYRYEGFTIWGFTLSVLVGVLNQSLEAGIDLQYPEPIRATFKS